MTAWQRLVAAVCICLALVMLRGATVRYDSYEGRFEPYFLTRQWLYQRYYKSHKLFLGRRDDEYPSPRCCTGEDCLQRTGWVHRRAVVTVLRTDNYVHMFERLACSLATTNPDVPLIVLAVRGELQPDTIETVEALAIVRYAEPVFFENVSSKRFGLNWLKIRLWQMTEVDALLYLDSDVEVLGSLAPVFDLPTDFAIALDLNKAGYWYSALGRGQAGVMFLRPCGVLAEHLLWLASAKPALRFPYHDAEQDYFDWYFRYSRMTLPLEYNALIEHVIWYFMGKDVPRLENAEAVNGTARLAAQNLSLAAGSAPVSRSWWNRGRKLAGMHIFEEPEEGAVESWHYVRQSEPAPVAGKVYVPHTFGGARVKVLHYAVESKPWLRRADCQAAARVRPAWMTNNSRDSSVLGSTAASA